ncbi:MAG TPA: hypothetical protein VMG99_08775 [Thermoplasmata archaeon]|nr:hypothetical protein [Thermoplasmata archaeon]
MKAVDTWVYDPLLGDERRVQIYVRKGRLVVRPWLPQFEETPATPRIAEARLALSEAARDARGSRGYVGSLPVAPAIIGPGTRERMARATAPKQDLQRDRAKYLAALLGPAVLAEAARKLGTKAPTDVPAADELVRRLETPGVRAPSLRSLRVREPLPTPSGARPRRL